MYTIEGIAAAILIVVTTYLMLSATTLYTPGETHVSDMQLEVLGNDALAMMDAPDANGANSSLETYLSGLPGEEATYYASNFTEDLSNHLNQNEYGHLYFTANVSFRDMSNNTVGSYFFAKSRNLTGLEHTVRATRWVYINDSLAANPKLDDRPQSVLLEVLIWRD